MSAIRSVVAAVGARAYRTSVQSRLFSKPNTSRLFSSAHPASSLDLGNSKGFVAFLSRVRTPGIPTHLCARPMATSAALEFEAVEIDNPSELNFILGHSHFIKTVEDIYEALVQSGTALKFGIAFCEASGDRKVRFDGNDDDLINLAKQNAMKLGAGHSFIVFLDKGFPVSVLNAIKAVPEVCRIHCATANPTTVIVAKMGEERKGIMGVIDGFVPVDYENEADKKARRDFLRMIGYKR